MDTKKSFVFALLFVFSPILAADTLALSPDHPDHYVVKKGDTLWDISGHFLQEPWRWPQIWERNPQIENPHLIYPGDVVNLVYRDGEPVLRVRRGGKGGRPLVKLSPRVRSEAHSRAIPSIPMDAIVPFLNDAIVATDEELGAAAYVVSPGRERLASFTDGRIYARGIAEDSQRRFGIYRQGDPYVDPDSGEVLGYEAIFVGDAVVEEFGDPATLLVARSLREVLIGDRLFPVLDERSYQSFIPREPAMDLKGTIISVVDGVSQIGRNDVVVLNLGSSQGVEIGDVLAVYQRGETIYDKMAEPEPFPYGGSSDERFPDGIDKDIDLFVDGIKRAFAQQRGEPVELPDERAGVLMVFRTFDRLSYGLVMESTRAIHIHDRVSNP